MMLLAHALPVEAAVAKKAGVRWRATLSLRRLGALTLGFLLNLLYQSGDYLSQPNQLIWQPQLEQLGLVQWLFEQLKLLLMILLIITVLLSVLRILKLLHIERLIHWLLSPFLRLLGLSKHAANTTVIGITLGLSFGGGLLINEAESGKLSQRDIFVAMAFLALCHSLIEDTLLIMLLGAHVSGVLWCRLAFALLITLLLSHLPDWKNSNSLTYRFCMNPPKAPH